MYIFAMEDTKQLAAYMGVNWSDKICCKLNFKSLKV